MHVARRQNPGHVRHPVGDLERQRPRGSSQHGTAEQCCQRGDEPEGKLSSHIYSLYLLGCRPREIRAGADPLPKPRSVSARHLTPTRPPLAKTRRNGNHLSRPRPTEGQSRHPFGKTTSALSLWHRQREFHRLLVRNQRTVLLYPPGRLPVGLFADLARGDVLEGPSNGVQDVQLAMCPELTSSSPAFGPA